MKSIIIATMAALTLSASAAVPTYQEARLIDLPQGSFHPVLSPDGSRLLFTTMDHTGLKCLTLATGAVTHIDSEAAAGFEPVFSNDGSSVYYRTSDYVDGLIWRDVRSFDLNKATAKQIAKPSRDIVTLKAIDNASYATSDFSRVNVTIDGATRFIAPVEGAQSYIWASLSPDRKRVVFTVAFKGVYVCDIDGSNLRHVSPRGIYPCWLDDNTVATLVQTDDGYFTTSSHIIACDLSTGNSLRITDDSVLIDEMTASSLTGAIVYSTFDGEMYILNPQK